MKLLVDNQLPEALAGFLTANGIEASHVRRLVLGAVSDAEIWNFAKANGFVIVTTDEDFQHLAARHRRWSGCGLAMCANPPCSKRFRQCLPIYATDLATAHQ